MKCPRCRYEASPVSASLCRTCAVICEAHGISLGALPAPAHREVAPEAPDEIPRAVVFTGNFMIAVGILGLIVAAIQVAAAGGALPTAAAQSVVLRLLATVVWLWIGRGLVRGQRGAIVAFAALAALATAASVWALSIAVPAGVLGLLMTAVFYSPALSAARSKWHVFG